MTERYLLKGRPTLTGIMTDIAHSPLVDSLWIPRRFVDGPFRILVLGESWYGDYGTLNSDHAYFTEYVEGRINDPLYTRVANALGFKGRPADFWLGVAFTNFAQCIGPTARDRPTRAHYCEAVPRLREVLRALTPAGVWIWGIGQSEYSAPVVSEGGIMLEVMKHPIRAGHAEIAESLAKLRQNLANASTDKQ